MAESAAGREALRREALEGARHLVAVNPRKALDEAHRVLALAHQEKVLAKRHRRRSQQNMDLFNEFKRNLEALGITVILEPPINSPTPAARGGASDNCQKDSP